ncbi:Gag protease polyprotein [Gossypium australe]|uniref:Gag protease polyprotein n=1 Tax=Gossypium australe TaxID=47621 RepID=A0A5B6WHP8_9ROSI|nr:Gag protease polyprotein [Gossypium australe]
MSNLSVGQGETLSSHRIVSAYFYSKMEMRTHNDTLCNQITKNAIWVIVDHCLKLHGVPMSIVSNRDPRFTLRFRKQFHELLNTRLNFSTAFHPQKDEQSERVIQILEDML